MYKKEIDDFALEAICCIKILLIAWMGMTITRIVMNWKNFFPIVHVDIP
jgi:hypothetical protein